MNTYAELSGVGRSAISIAEQAATWITSQPDSPGVSTSRKYRERN